MAVVTQMRKRDHFSMVRTNLGLRIHQSIIEVVSIKILGSL